MNNAVIFKRQPANYRFTTGSYDQVQLIFVTAGALYYHVQEAEAVALRPGQYALLRFGGRFTLQCRDEGYRGVGIMTEPPYPAPLRGAALLGAVTSSLDALLRVARAHLEGPLPESGAILNGLAEALIWQTLAVTREQAARSGRDWAAAARTALETNLGAGMPLRRILAAIPLSYRQLSRHFQARYGQGLKTYQAALRLSEAQRLLRETTLDITTIAFELGYASSQHFAADFRRAFGATPRAFRQRRS
ncbi:MAG: AraC family transcriptional regulator [Candidatus Marinimicrobia bacterium]|nr:AraC family transcriptional regulator [Candidatus Neomarinimicrobiota bacterium]